MANSSCKNGTMDTAKYSAPLPVIGLYIAAGSSVCFFFMLYDIASGIRNRKRWFPCKLFSLHSVLLTLLSVAAKIPLDLTTSMPSPEDQLSKLSGTTMLCISMGFLMPSLGINRESEYLSNMAALSIFVITVAVNICIQMSTGVIYLFMREHIIILCCMLLLLMFLWNTSLHINSHKSHLTEDNKFQLTDHRYKSLSYRLMSGYLHGYESNPQLILCQHLNCAFIAWLCVLCLIVLVQAALRCLILKQVEFCPGSSDYGWSMWAVVVSQILTVIVGSVATGFRWLTLFDKTNMFAISYDGPQYLRNERSSNPILKLDLRDYCEEMFMHIIHGVTLIVDIMIIFPSLAVCKVIEKMAEKLPTCGLFKHKSISGFEAIIVVDGRHTIFEGSRRCQHRIVRNCIVNMKRWMEVSSSNSFNHLNTILSRIVPSQQLYATNINVSSLSIVLLVKIAEVSIPNNFSGSLVQAFGEAYKVIEFTDTKSHFKLAKAVWKGNDFSVLLPRIFGGSFQFPSDLDRALVVITEIKYTLTSSYLKKELKMITDYISCRSYSSIQHLYDFLEQLFVDMLHAFLTRLPIVIFNRLHESPVEEYEEKFSTALKLIGKIGLLQDRIKWSFPEGYDVSSFIGPVDFVALGSLHEAGAFDLGKNLNGSECAENNNV